MNHPTTYPISHSTPLSPRPTSPLPALPRCARMLPQLLLQAWCHCPMSSPSSLCPTSSPSEHQSVITEARRAANVRHHHTQTSVELADDAQATVYRSHVFSLLPHLPSPLLFLSPLVAAVGRAAEARQCPFPGRTLTPATTTPPPPRAREEEDGPGDEGPLAASSSQPPLSPLVTARWPPPQPHSSQFLPL